MRYLKAHHFLLDFIIRFFIRDLSHCHPTLTQLHIDNLSWFTDDQERVRRLTRAWRGGRSIKVGPGSHLDPVTSSSVSHQYRSVAKNLRGLSRVRWIKSFLLRISAFSRNKFVILMINDDNDGTRASDGHGAGKTKRCVDQVPRLQKKTHWYLAWFSSVILLGPWATQRKKPLL